MSPQPSEPSADELARLEALARYQILDTAAEAAYDELTQLAAQICGTPIALISLLDHDRQWFKSRVGLTVSETPRAIAFCDHTILQAEPLVVQDALLDERFATNPLVTGDPHIWFYAGIPLTTPDHYRIGTLSVIDRVARQLSADQMQALQVLSRQVVSQLELHRHVAVLQASERRLQQKVQQETLVRVVTERIRQSLELDTILTTTVTEIRQVLQTDRVMLFQLEPDGSGYVVQESVDVHWQALLGQKLVDPYFQASYIQKYFEGRVSAVADTNDGSLQPCYADFLRQLDVQANLVVPILQTGHLWGLLIAQQCAQPRRWSEDEIQLLKLLADQVAIAIQQASLYRQTQLELTERHRAEAALYQLNQALEQRVQARTEALQKQAEQEQLLRLVTQRIHASFDLETILETALTAGRQTLLADRVAVYRFHPDWSGHFIAESVAAGWLPLVSLNMPKVWEDTYLQETQGGRYQHGETFAVNDIYTVGHRQCHLELLEQFQARAYAIVPIFVHDQLWGLLAAYQNATPRHWHEADVELLRQIALQVAIAIQQSTLYQTAQAQVQALERLDQVKDDFLSTVSHELRSPMTSIKMATQMLEIQLTRTGVLNSAGISPISRYFKILKEQSEREIQLINDLLDLARLDANTDPLTLTNLDLRLWVEQLAGTFSERTQQQQQRLQLEIPSDLALATDFSYLERILAELLHNACKYTPAGETIRITASQVEGAEALVPSTSSQQAQAAVQICVSSTGVDIPPEEGERIFDKFYRILKNDPWKHGGTGLGLALVKKLTERLGGSIHVVSGDGQTTFVLTLASGE